MGRCAGSGLQGTHRCGGTLLRPQGCMFSNSGLIWLYSAQFTPTDEAGNEATLASGSPVTRLASSRVARSGETFNSVPFCSISFHSYRPNPHPPPSPRGDLCITVPGGRSSSHPPARYACGGHPHAPGSGASPLSLPHSRGYASRPYELCKGLHGEKGPEPSRERRLGLSDCESLPVRFRSEGGQPLTHFDSFRLIPCRNHGRRWGRGARFVCTGTTGVRRNGQEWQTFNSVAFGCISLLSHPPNPHPPPSPRGRGDLQGCEVPAFAGTTGGSLKRRM